MKKTVFSILLLSALALMTLCSCSAEREESSNFDLLTESVKRAKDGDWRKSYDFASRASTQNSKDISSLIMEGLALEYTGKPQLAIGRLENAVELAPDCFMAQYSLGRMLYDSREYKKCLKPLKKARKLDKKNTNVVVLLANAMSKLDLSGSLSYYAIALTSGRFKKTAAPWNQLGVTFAKNKKLRDALKCLIKAYKLAPDNHVVVLNLGIFLDKYLNKKSKAKKYYYKYLELTAENLALETKRKEIIKRIKEISS